MDKNNMAQIFAHYIKDFAKLNDEAHEEYYKWQICHEFPRWMDKALAASDGEFPSALYKAKVCSRNIIDSFTQPFYGLVKFAEEEPATVRQMFRDLYAPDDGDLVLRMQKIKDFLTRVMNCWTNIIRAVIFINRIPIPCHRICFCMTPSIIICIRRANARRWRTVLAFMTRGERGTI